MPVNKKLGIIDTQDAILGNPVYDLASLVDDVRVKSMSDLIIYLDNQTRPGDESILTLFNNDSEPTQLVVTLGTRPTNR